MNATKSNLLGTQWFLIFRKPKSQKIVVAQGFLGDPRATEGQPGQARPFEWHSRGQRLDPAYLHQGMKSYTGDAFLVTTSSRGKTPILCDLDYLSLFL